ncbi:MAG: penicillin acylase family protein [Thalassobaculales bacterium]
MLRWIGRGLLALTLLAALATGGGYLWLRGSLPQIAGEEVEPGLTAPVEITRDPLGIPRIIAANELDAAHALGFVHAQDRLWQMEQMRRLARGRLSELAGRRTLAIDRMMRLWNLPALAEATLERLPRQVRLLLDAYAAGVNGFLAGHSGPLPPEFVLLRLRPAPWTAVDSLLWGRLMALQLSGNWREELTRARLLQKLSPAEVETLHASDDPTQRRPLAGSSLPAGVSFAAVDGLVDLLGPRSASNAWAVSGQRSASGQPLLAGDPHLGLGAPNHWYLARIQTPGLTLAGATWPGVPLLVMGHNGRVGWGLTTTNGDTADIVVETIDPADPGRYLSPSGPRPFILRQETVRLADGGSEVFTVRATQNGVVVSDLPDQPQAPDGRVLVLRSTALLPDDVTPTALYDLNRAQSLDEAVEALRNFGAPQQNVVLADTQGAIALVPAGRVPVRAGADGYLPVDGTTGEGEWLGFLPFESLPIQRNPRQGFVANGNDSVVPEGWAGFGHDFAPPQRGRRIADLLRLSDRHSRDGFLAIQKDDVSLAARALLPVLLSVPAADQRALDAIALLKPWDGAMRRDRPEPLIFSAWVAELKRRLFAERLGPLGGEVRVSDPAVLVRVLTSDTTWCDRPSTTTVVEGCPQAVAEALRRALDELTREFGPNLAAWRWGAWHRASFAHAVFGRVPLLRDLTGVTLETSGDDHTINRGGTRAGAAVPPPLESAFRHVHGAGVKMVLDFADLDSSRFVLALGQSGNPLSRHYRDLATGWRDSVAVELRPLPPGHSTLYLVPP